MQLVNTYESETENFPSLITIARDPKISPRAVTRSTEPPPERFQMLCNSFVWTNNIWKPEHDALSKSFDCHQRFPEKLRTSISHTYSDCIVFICSDVNSAMSMYLSWLDGCDERLSKQVVKPLAHIVIINNNAPSLDDFIKMCSKNPKAGKRDNNGLRYDLFAATEILSRPIDTLRIYHDIAAGVPCLQWHELQEAHYSARRQRENLGMMWSLRNLARLRKAWCAGRGPPNPIDVLTAKFSTLEPENDQSTNSASLGPVSRHEKWNSKSLELLVTPHKDIAEVERHAVPVVASVLAQHTTLSNHWSDRSEFLRKHFDLRYRLILVKILSEKGSVEDYSIINNTNLDCSHKVGRLVEGIRRCWMRQVRILIKCETRLDARRVHINNLSRHIAYLQTRDYEGTCSSCVLQSWTTLLPCKHGLCTLCLRAAGGEIGAESQLHLHCCPICQQSFPSSTYFPVEPPTATGRVLALDGGGVRGIVQLEILQLLEKQIGLDIPFAGYFDLIVGTSIGGICALGLGKRGWSIEECKEKFLVLTRRVFSSMSTLEEYLTWATRGWYKALKSTFKVLLTDSLYDTDLVESVLQDAFGSSLTMVSPRSHTKEPRVAVIVDEASSSTCKILPTYNKAGHIRARQYDWPVKYQKFQVWEAGRCTSAAPSYWHPKELFDEIYQDGGIDWNNPTAIARQEAKVLFPSGIDRNLIVSVGCGRTRSSSLNGKSFLWRLWKNFNDKIDAEKQHDNIFLFIEKEHLSLHRLNPCLDLDQVRLNDWSSIPALQSAIMNTLRIDNGFQQQLVETARLLLASLFYFELGKKRVCGQSLKSFSGVVLSRLNAKELQDFITKYEGAKFEVNGSILPLRIPLTADLASVGEHDSFQVNLLIGRRAYPINGSPFTIEQLRDAQRDFLPLADIYTRKRKLSNLSAA